MHRQAHILHAFKHTKQTWEHLANSMHVAVPEGCFLISLKCLTMHTAAISWKKTHFALTVFSAPRLLQEVYLYKKKNPKNTSYYSVGNISSTLQHPL